MTTYYKVSSEGPRGYDAGEILARCEANSRRQALRKFRLNDGNLHLSDAVPESKLKKYADSVYDPALLLRF